MYYLHHIVDDDHYYVGDTSDWSMSCINSETFLSEDVQAETFDVKEGLPDDTEDISLARFWETFCDKTGTDVNAWMYENDLYSLTEYLRVNMDTALRFDAKIDIWANDSYIFCRGYTLTGLCICWYTDGEDINFFSFSGLDINTPCIMDSEDAAAILGKDLWEEAAVGIFYTPAMTKIAFVKFFDNNGMCEPDLKVFPWGNKYFLGGTE